MLLGDGLGFLAPGGGLALCGPLVPVTMIVMQVRVPVLVHVLPVVLPVHPMVILVSLVLVVLLLKGMLVPSSVVSVMDILDPHGARVRV